MYSVQPQAHTVKESKRPVWQKWQLLKDDPDLITTVHTQSKYGRTSDKLHGLYVDSNEEETCVMYVDSNEEETCVMYVDSNEQETCVLYVDSNEEETCVMYVIVTDWYQLTIYVCYSNRLMETWYFSL